MSNNLLRRDVLALGGGSVVGLLLTPAPWRLVTDTALWSQNWSWIPKLGRGEIRSRYTHCPLCPAGCAAKVRCLETQPLSLTGIAADGALCPYGLTIHHLPYHPARLLQAIGQGRPVEAAKAAQQIAAAVAQRRAGDGVAVLDLRPGRTASWMYRRALAAVPDGLYLTPSRPEANGADLARVKTVLSFGVPVLDGWGAPGQVLAHRDRFRLIQVEPVESRSALLADLWLPARPGSEFALAQALLGQVTPAQAAAATGLEAAQIESAAGMLAEGSPALVLGDVAEVAALNTKFSAPLFPLRDVPVPREWNPAAPVIAVADVPDRSISVLFIDESLPGEALPWDAIARKLVVDPLVVSFACSRQGYARYAAIALPAPVPVETVQEMTGSASSPASSYRIAPPLSPAPAAVVDPPSIVAAACGFTLPEKAVEQRARAVHESGRGRLVAYAGAASTPVKDTKFEDFWKTLNEGGRWDDDVAPAAVAKAAPPATRSTPPAADSDSDLPLTVLVGGHERGPATPLMTKIYHESGLLQGSNQALLHPDTARAAGLGDGARALLQTRCGRCEVRVKFDAGAMPGVVELVEGPVVMDLCQGRSARAKVVRL